MSTTQTSPATTRPASWYRTRDDYGRSVHELCSAGSAVAVVVVLPKPARRPGRTHMVNLRNGDEVTFHASLAIAKQYVETAKGDAYTVR